MKTQLVAGLFMLGSSFSAAPTANTSAVPVRRPEVVRPVRTTEQTKIQVALLIDTSSSMDGLIEQTKSQLWQIVNELATARYANVQPTLEIALYEYGNDGLNRNDGFTRQVLPFTTDLDKVSEELFKLRTNGGDEYCGYVIDRAVSQLQWTGSTSDLKIIYIAGNESFTQGNIDYKKSCKDAITKGIVVNTIYCGGVNEGISGMWKAGSELADGKYFNIDQNESTVYVSTPWDDELVQLNSKLNETYIAYGTEGEEYKVNQQKQDKNASGYGKSNMVERVTSKSSGVYNNKSWDLVDASKDSDFKVDDLKKEELPVEMRNMTENERRQYIDKKSKEREDIQKQINALNKKRNDYIAEEQKKTGEANNLGNAMKNSVHEIANKKNYTFQ